MSGGSPDSMATLVEIPVCVGLTERLLHNAAAWTMALPTTLRHEPGYVGLFFKLTSVAGDVQCHLTLLKGQAPPPEKVVCAVKVHDIVERVAFACAQSHRSHPSAERFPD